MTTTTIRAPSSHDGGVRFPVKARLFGAGVAGAVSLSLAAIPPDGTRGTYRKVTFTIQ